jgi:hypothetical protein
MEQTSVSPIDLNINLEYFVFYFISRAFKEVLDESEKPVFHAT